MSRVTDNGDGTISVALKHPIELGKSTIQVVTIRTECTVSDLEEMDRGKGDVEKTILLIGGLSRTKFNPEGVSADALRKMRAGDYMLLAKEAGKVISAEGDEGE